MDNLAYSYPSENLYENFDPIHAEFFSKDFPDEINDRNEYDEKPIISFGYDSPPSLNSVNYLSNGHEYYYSLLARISEIGALPNNWNDNGAEKFSFDILSKSREFLVKIEKNLPEVHIFPTAADSIQFEWEADNFYCEVEVKSDVFTLYAEKDGEEIWDEEFLNINDASNKFVDLFPS